MFPVSYIMIVVNFFRSRRSRNAVVNAEGDVRNVVGNLIGFSIGVLHHPALSISKNIRRTPVVSDRCPSLHRGFLLPKPAQSRRLLQVHAVGKTMLPEH